MATRDPVEVTVVVGDQELIAGTLWIHDRQGQSATFRYDQTYLAHPSAYPLDPTLPLSSGVIPTRPGQEMFNAFADSAPDRWGQNLMRRQERDRAASAGTRPRTLTSADFLLGTHDQLRHGAIRFRRPGSTDYWSPAPHGVPKLVSLPRLLDATDQLTGDGIDSQPIRDLTRDWSILAKHLALPLSQISRMQPAFDSNFRSQAEHLSRTVNPPLAPARRFEPEC